MNTPTKSYRLSTEALQKLERLATKNCRSQAQQLTYMINEAYKPETITVVIREPLVTVLHFPHSVYNLPPGGTLRMLLGDSVYTFTLEADTNTIHVNMEKPGIHDFPRPEPTQ